MEAASSPDAPRLPNPWWLPPFLGRVPAVLEPAHLRLLGALALVFFFEEYDIAMLTAALRYIAADLRMAEAELGSYLGTIRLGAVGALLFVPLADRVGRRRVLLLSLVGCGLASGATAFAQTPQQFVGCQMVVRTFFVSGTAMCFTILIEEFPATVRGWGVGVLGALGATGHAFAALIFANIERLPHGWRSLYLVGLAPVLAFPWIRRSVPETARFEKQQLARAHEAPGGWLSGFAPLAHLARRHPARAAGISLVAVGFAFGSVAAFQFTGYYTLGELGWEPWHYSAMFVLGGACGIVGSVAAGRLGDRFGRRLVGAAMCGGFPCFVALFYWGPGVLVPLGWIGFVFGSQGGRTVIRAFASELFPTDHRATATGWYNVIDTLGAASGLFLLGLAATQEGDLARITPFLALATLLGGLVLLRFPETRQRELESIHAESPGASEAR